MTKRKSDLTLPTTSLDELFSSQEERDDAKLERVKEIPLNELHPFKEHPFKIQNDNENETPDREHPSSGHSRRRSHGVAGGRVRVDLRT